MAKSIWNASDRQSLLARFDSLSPEMAPRWGRITVSQMVKHCTVPILSTTGEFPATQKRTFFRIWPMQKLVIYVLPWPKGAPAAPESIITDNGDLSERVAALRVAVGKFVARGESQEFAPHAAFGPLGAKDWGALVHRHLDHHLQQFGV
ncbi:MAG: DUF1569 domain-containing protein [Acidobacteria bacterium]|nr:DUF1569 domain-containing protein [Acidobacteriota bacterium]